MRDYLRVISEYAEYGMRASQDLGRLARLKIQPVECLMLVSVLLGTHRMHR